MMSSSTCENALFEAIARCDLAAVRESLLNGSEVRAVDADTGLQAIHFAALHGCEEIGKLLIERGANCNSFSRAGRTPLLECAYESPVAVIRALPWLYDARADTNIMDGNHMTALSVIALAPERESSVDAVRDLLYHTANVHQVVGHVSLLKAVESRTKEAGRAGAAARDIARMLKAQGAISADIAPLTVAIERGRVDEVARLLNAGADPNVRHWLSGEDILLNALSDPFDIAQLLINAGAKVRSKHLVRLLGPALRSDGDAEAHADMAERLVAAGASWTAKNEYGDSLFVDLHRNRATSVLMKRALDRAKGVRTPAARALGLTKRVFDRIWKEHERVGWHDPPKVERPPPDNGPLGRKTCFSCSSVSFVVSPECPECGIGRWWLPSD